VRSATVTPWWWGLRTLVKVRACGLGRGRASTCAGRGGFVTAAPAPPPQYRTSKNYQDGEFLGPRIGDKVRPRGSAAQGQPCGRHGSYGHL
jgi:ATP-binding cassette subfamily G (WHITE) protein 2